MQRKQRECGNKPRHCVISLVYVKLEWSYIARFDIYVNMTITTPRPCQPGKRLYDHDDVIKWKQFPRYWLFVRGIHRSPVNSPHKGQWREALMFSLICVWINGRVNNREAGDLRRYRDHYDVIVTIVQAVLGVLLCYVWLAALRYCSRTGTNIST